MGSCRAISNNIAASTSVFHVLGRIPRAWKTSASEGYIVGYSPPRPNIHITYIEKSRNITPTKKEQKSPERHLGKKNLDQCLIRKS